MGFWLETKRRNRQGLTWSVPHEMVAYPGFRVHRVFADRTDGVACQSNSCPIGQGQAGFRYLRWIPVIGRLRTGDGAHQQSLETLLRAGCCSWDRLINPHSIRCNCMNRKFDPRCQHSSEYSARGCFPCDGAVDERCIMSNTALMRRNRVERRELAYERGILHPYEWSYEPLLYEAVRESISDLSRWTTWCDHSYSKGVNISRLVYFINAWSDGACFERREPASPRSSTC